MLQSSSIQAGRLSILGDQDKKGDNNDDLMRDNSDASVTMMHDSADTSAYVDNEDRDVPKHDRESINLSISRNENEISIESVHVAESMGLDLSGRMATNYSDNKILPQVATGGIDLASAQIDESINFGETTIRKRKATRQSSAKKRRKIFMDGDDTELSNDHIRSMLADTKDIVKQTLFDPLKFEDKVDDEDRVLFNISDGSQALFVRPALGDDGHLAPKLLELWFLNTSTVLGETFPYELHSENDISDTKNTADETITRSSPATQTTGEEKEELEIENTRHYDSEENMVSLLKDNNQEIVLQQMEKQNKEADDSGNENTDYHFAMQDNVDDNNVFVFDDNNVLDQDDQVRIDKENDEDCKSKWKE